MVVLPEETRDIAGKMLEVIVEDVTFLDSPATILARFRSRVEELPRVGRRLGPVDINVELPDSKAYYNVRAKLLSGEALSIGDLISTQSHPVSLGQDELTMDIRVQLV